MALLLNWSILGTVPLGASGCGASRLNSAGGHFVGTTWHSCGGHFVRCAVVGRAGFIAGSLCGLVLLASTLPLGW